MDAENRGFTSIGHATPARAMKSSPLRPTSPNVRTTAAASDSALRREASSSGNRPGPIRLPQ